MSEPEWIATFLGDGFELTSLYEDFWARVQKLAGKPVRPKKLAPKPAVEEAGKSLRFDFGRTGDVLVLRGLPCVNAPGASAFDVYVSGSQVVRRIKTVEAGIAWVLVASEFDVLFLNALDDSFVTRAWEDKRKESSAYAGYRFTIASVDPVRHFPDCYAQYSLDAIEPARIQRLYKDDDSGWKARATHRQPAVPSAPLDLVSIIYVLLHQHVSKSVSNGWPWDMSELLGKLPAVRFGVDARSQTRGWYDHSHVAKETTPLKRWPEEFVVPAELAEAGWGTRIAGLERLETPHVTVNRGEDRSRRVNIRKRHGAMLEGSDDIPKALWDEIVRTLPAWRELWKLHYPKLPIGELED